MEAIARFFDDRPVLTGAIFIVVLLFVVAAIQISSAYFEAQAFNRATGKNVSTWDALFIELRLNDSPKD